jgi:hypothetical protein
MVPNHAVVLLALLHGGDDFQKSLMIANTAGWDTDCNSGNVGCLLGIKNGLAGIEAGPDWRGPVADRMYLPTSDGARAITDAVQETYHVVNVGRALAGQEPRAPKNGARFHFSLSGSVQGFRSEDSPEARGAVTVGHDNGRLALRYCGVAPGRPGRTATATFIPPEAAKMGGYGLISSPTLYPGQTVRAELIADANNARPVRANLYVRVYGAKDQSEIIACPVHEPPQEIAPGDDATLEWVVPDTGGRPVFEVGVEIGGASGTGTLFVDSLTWDGTPKVTLTRPEGGGDLWRRAWVNAADHFDPWGTWDNNVFKLIQDEGTGMVLQGEFTWSDYTVATSVYPHMASAIGVAANVRGLVRYVAVTLTPDGVARLVEKHDRDETVLAEAPVPWELDRSYPVTITSLADGTITATVGDAATLKGRVTPERARGAVALLVREGHGQFGPVTLG